ncbi:MAG: 2-dehydropantoate 2-reductase [Actinomycetota bacterium]
METSESGIAVIGPGAIGGAVAGALVDAGHEPVIAARTHFDDLRVEHPAGSVEAAVAVQTSPDAVERSADVIFLAVKAHQTATAAPWLDALAGPGTAVVVLQNGVEHRERLAGICGPGVEVIPAVVNLPARRLEPGVVRVGGPARLTLERTAQADEAASLFDDSFLRAKAVDDWLTPAWTKLVLNAASGGLCVLTRTDNTVFADPAAQALARSLMAEVIQVGRAEGAHLPDDLPDRIFEGLTRHANGHMASIVVDRIEGHATEWQARNAVIGRIAERHGIDVPINRMLTDLIRLGEPEA